MKIIEELRIGNYILFQSGNTHKIKLSDFADILDDESDEEYYYPLLLTEDWLAKFEFKKQDDHIWIFPNNSSLRLWGFAWNVQQFSLNTKGDHWDDIITPSIKYVHQLQNLHYTLTGKELKKG